jgi:cytochrome c oxidase subunit II
VAEQTAAPWTDIGSTDGMATLGPSGTERATTGLLRSRRSRRIASLSLLVGPAMLALSGCTSSDLPDFAMSDAGATNQSGRVLFLWQGAWIAALATGAVVWGLILWSVIFHRRKRDETGLPPQTRYNVPIEVLYTMVPLIMIGVFFYFTARDEDRLQKVSAHPDHRIRVQAERWSWQFTYDGDPATTVTGTPGNPPTLYLPSGESVVFSLHSRDVIHSFWVPAFNYKMDVIPGQVNHFQITPEAIGSYDGRCAELCGQDHSRMLFNVKIVQPGAYRAKVAQIKAQAEAAK